MLLRAFFIPSCLIFLVASCAVGAEPLSGLLSDPFSDPFSLEDSLQAPCLQSAPGAMPEQPLNQPINQPLSLAEVIDLALCHNPKTRAAWANARAEAASTGVAQAAYLPNVDATLEKSRQRSRTAHSSATTNHQQSAGALFSYLLFDFGGRAANLENHRQLLNAAIAQQDTTRQAVFLEAVQAFYQVHASAAAVEAALASETAAARSFKAAEARHKAGVATPVDKLQAQTAFSQAELNRIRLEGQWRNAKGVLANVLGLNANRPIPLQSPDFLRSSAHLANDRAALDEDFSAQLETWMETIKRERPDLRAAEARYRAAEASVDLARSQGLPTLKFSTSSNHRRLDHLDNHSGSLNLTLNIPLFSGFADIYRIRAAEAHREASAIEREQLEQRASLEVWQAWQDLKTATQSINTTENLYASAEAAERMALGRYQSGVGNILDLLNAQSALSNARMQRISAAYDWHMSRAALARALGRLDKRLLDAPFSFAEP